MDYKRKQMTKQQVWDKLHEERRMWQEKLEYDVRQATMSGILQMKAAYEPILALMVRAFGVPDGEYGELRLDVNKPESKDGYIWTARVEDIDDKTLRVWAKEVSTEELNM